jgi:hypothetical protein
MDSAAGTWQGNDAAYIVQRAGHCAAIGPGRIHPVSVKQAFGVSLQAVESPHRLSNHCKPATHV